MPLSDNPYREYLCSRNSPLSCDQVQQTIQEQKGARFCMECGFPTTLSPEKEIQGRRGTYRIKRYLGARGYGRLYAAVRSTDGQPILIKEYLLPKRSFNSEETRQRKETFVQVAGLTPADGRIQDFRLVPIIEAIADQREERCYLITQEKHLPLTLNHYLTKYGAMNTSQVREVLNQVLQTLQFLHNQKFRRPSGQTDKGVAHGNLDLESLLLVGDVSQFYIYLCDLADWEFLFQPVATPSASISQVKPQPAQDLVALGQVAFYLWSGKTRDATEQVIDPRNPQHWPASDPNLKRFILRLMGVDQPFESAEAARQALRQLSSYESSHPHVIATDAVASDKPRSKRWLWLFGILAFLCLGAGLWYLFKPRSSVQAGLAAYQQLQYKKMADVSGIEPGDFNYVSEQDGTWSFVLRQPIRNGTLGNLLLRPKPDVEAQFIHQGVTSATNLQEVPIPSGTLASVQNEQAEFAITSLTDGLPNDLEEVPIAYDGLLVFVPFNKGQNLSKTLNGQISLENLRRLYTGEITNWQQLGGPDLPVAARIPPEPEAVRLFQRRVLQDDSQAINRFWQTVELQPTSTTLQEGRNAFAAGEAGIISFGILSKTWNQCGGYPLAISAEGQAVQALVRLNGQSVTPNVNLCDKANRLDVTLFRSNRYPLGYPLFVVYPKDNRRLAGHKFAELLNKTQEGQCLLHEVGLVPLQPVPDDCP